MAGNFHTAVVDHDFGGVQHDPHRPSYQPHWYRVAVGSDADLRVSIHAQTEQPTGLERLLRQRPQQRLFSGEVLAHRPRPRPDPPLVILRVPLLDQRVQLGQRRDLRDRDQVITAEVADLALHPALLVGTDAEPVADTVWAAAPSSEYTYPARSLVPEAGMKVNLPAVPAPPCHLPSCG